MDKDLYRVIVEVEGDCGTNEVMGGRVGLEASDRSGFRPVRLQTVGGGRVCLWP